MKTHVVGNFSFFSLICIRYCNLNLNRWVRVKTATIDVKMRVRKCMALVGAILIFLCCLIVYRMADYTLYAQEDSRHQFQVKQSSYKRNGRFFDVKKGSLEETRIFSSHNTNKPVMNLKETCQIPTNDVAVNIQMSEVYKELKFDNLDGGVWKQGWNIELDAQKWSSGKKLTVYVVPHSHNDPGWLKTFEDYYISETRNILNNMLKKLYTDPKKKFIWAEISFFSLWWDELSEDDQQKVRRLVEAGQLELVTGGWVMNDEANTHYYSMITQLTEGHQWLKANLNIEPKNGWTIDPFGESPVMPYFLKKMGLENLVIQRVHYSVKKYFARTKNLEFRWRQTWDGEGSTDLFTHMTPFYSYDIPHTCGPNPKICCQFDFKRLPGNGVSCPWKEPPKLITKKNVAVRAQMLLDQYRKKAELYRTNVILVPLGDDFRYQSSLEWDSQFDNYYKIMNYINSNPELHANVSFGTLADFFGALAEESSVINFPTLAGDFFTYADRDDHYWSGYYTSRPFYKRIDRVLINYHRSAEILFAFGWSARTLANAKWLLSPQTGFAKMLRDARRNLGLFQHHDGITGTARDNVMEDYARKMVSAITHSQHIIQQVTHFLLSPRDRTYLVEPEQIYFDFDDQRRLWNGSPERKIIIAEGESKTLIFFNSLSYKRSELVSVQVFTPYVEILDWKGNPILHQTNPFFLRDAAMDDSRFEIYFVAEIPALGLATYKILAKVSDEYVGKTFSKVKVFNPVGPVKHSKGFENFETGNGREFSIDNQFISVTLSENGLLKSVTNKKTGEFTPLHLDFVRYLARKGKERSGAYLFLPDGEAKIVKAEFPLIRVCEGPLFSRVEVKLADVRHYLTVYSNPRLDDVGLEIVNVVDITGRSNYELAMRFTSHVKSGSEFFTDLNGFQMIKRQRLAKLPIQGNFYPMPSASFIEDEKHRLTIVSGQPLGATSLREGELEVLQDRRLQQDDNRGLGQGVLDNKVTSNVFRILVEGRLKSCRSPSSLLSATAYKSRLSLLHPLTKMIWKKESQSDLQELYSPVGKDLPSDLHLLSVRTFDEEDTNSSAGFVFHRSHLDFCFADSGNPGDGIVNLQSFLPNHFGEELRKSSLSFLREEGKLSKKEDLQLCHMDLQAVLMS